jgi:acetoin utilization deacetylase AcuC-like enzyme/GNAT superfamily N-acetyltransferase
MFRIRRVFDDVVPIDQSAISQVQEIMRTHFAGLPAEEIEALPAKLKNPIKYRFRHVLLVGEGSHRNVRGFALPSYDPVLNFCYLDYLASAASLVGSGVGGALYERVRDHAKGLGAIGVFFECLPDDPAEVTDPQMLKANIARIRFYERYGARPIINNEYTLPLRPDQKNLPYLMFDALDNGKLVGRDRIRRIVRTILESKYGHLCPKEYIDRVVESFRGETLQLRPPKYVKKQTPIPPRPRPADAQIALVVNDKHNIHHVHERGYVESPVRISAILSEIQPTGLFRLIQPKVFAESHIRKVHDGRFVDYLKKTCEGLPEGKSLYPYVFPIRNETRPPKDRAVCAGYYCIDTFTPLNRNAWLAAKRAVDCALTAADAVLGGQRVAYALVRPPGHHAERACFGGFCYFNTAAIAAQYFVAYGKVAVLDIDYHHGNGTQEIFYQRDDVLTLSIHGHPRFAYPYFSGFEEERGEGLGEGFNVNYPLPEKLDGPRYAEALQRALSRIRRFGPKFLVLALGLDTAKNDPTGTWTLGPRDFEHNGRLIGAMGLPTLVVQEGGYRSRTLGTNARRFFIGLAQTAFAIAPTKLSLVLRARAKHHRDHREREG